MTLHFAKRDANLLFRNTLRKEIASELGCIVGTNSCFIYFAKHYECVIISLKCVVCILVYAVDSGGDDIPSLQRVTK